MSIWDNIAKGVSDAASYTAKKTGELTTLAKMKYSLHSEESKLSECFEEIGKLYYAYQREGTDYISEIAALISEADLVKTNIACMKEEIARLQNDAICQSCGAKIDASMCFCPVCGAKQERHDHHDDGDSDCGCSCCCGGDAEEKSEDKPSYDPEIK